MTFSIIVPVYKVEKYLENSVNSLLNQNYHDFEIILIDDCSPDKCGAMCDNLAKKSSKIRVIHNKINMGLSETRNIGTAAAKGDWIWFVDSDDYIASNSLDVLSNYISQGLDIVLFGFQYMIEKKNFDVYGSKVNMPIELKCASTKGVVDFVLDNDIKHSFSPAWNKVYRRDFILNNSLKFKNTAIEDIFYNFEAFSCTNRITSIQECLYFYLRRVSGSLSKSKSLETTDIYKARYESALEFLRKKDLLTWINRIKAFYCYFTRLFYVLYVSVVSNTKK